MPTIRASLHSPRAAGEVLAYLARFSNTREWDPSVTAASELTPGPPAIGSRYRLWIKSGGRRLELEYVVTELSSQHVVLVARDRRLEGRDRIDVLTADDGGCTVTYEATIRPRGVFRLATPLIAATFRSLAADALEGLRRVLDAQ